MIAVLRSSGSASIAASTAASAIDRQVVSLGASYQLPANMFVDLGILYVLPGSNETADEPFAPEYKGTYNVSALVMALSFGMTFGADQADLLGGDVSVEPVLQFLSSGDAFSPPKQYGRGSQFQW